MDLFQAMSVYVKVVEAGTWFAGRMLAAERRQSGGPPIAVESDGTVF